MAITSLVCGALGFFLCFATSILGVIFGHIAKSQIDKSDGAEEGHGLAVAGLITGYIGTAIGVLIIIAIAAGA